MASSGGSPEGSWAPRPKFDRSNEGGFLVRTGAAGSALGSGGAPRSQGQRQCTQRLWSLPSQWRGGGLGLGRVTGPPRNGSCTRMSGTCVTCAGCATMTWRGGGGKRPPQQPAQPQYANYWAPLTRKRHTNHWAPRTRKRHQQEHQPQRPTESSDPTQHAKGRAGDCPGPRKETTTRRNVTQGGGVIGKCAATRVVTRVSSCAVPVP